MKIKRIKRITITKKDIFILVFVLIIISLFLLFKIINNKVTPVLLDYASAKATSVATQVITVAVNEEVFKKMKTEDLFIITKDSKGNVISETLDPIMVNKLLNLVTNYVQEYLIKVEKGDALDINTFNNFDKKKLKKGIIFEIPSGVVFKNSLLSNLGPKVPVRINLVGDVISDIDTNITNYGINNALLKVNLKVDVNMQVILPISKRKVNATTNIPIVLKIIEGRVPEYYYDMSSIKR